MSPPHGVTGFLLKKFESTILTYYLIDFNKFYSDSEKSDAESKGKKKPSVKATKRSGPKKSDKKEMTDITKEDNSNKDNQTIMNIPPSTTSNKEEEVPVEIKSNLEQILNKYFGEDPGKKAQMMDISLIKLGLNLFKINILGEWRQVRRDGVDKIKKSITQKGVNRLIYFYIMDNEDGTYTAIDCNHRVVAFGEMEIKQAMCLVFPKLSKEEQEYIAGCANELHDEGCVHVTDWDKFRHISKYFENPKFQSERGPKLDLIVKHVVNTFTPCGGLTFLGS